MSRHGRYPIIHLAMTEIESIEPPKAKDQTPMHHANETDRQNITSIKVVITGNTRFVQVGTPARGACRPTRR